eukprot:9917571-Alexandrium_andersonii.AAC.1
MPARFRYRRSEHRQPPVVPEEHAWRKRDACLQSTREQNAMRLRSVQRCARCGKERRAWRSRGIRE